MAQVKYVRRWQKNSEKRVYVNFVNGASATLFLTGNKFQAPKSWQFDRCNAEDVDAAKSDPRCYADGKWIDTPGFSLDMQPASSVIKRGYTEDAREDIEAGLEFETRLAQRPTVSLPDYLEG